MKFRFAVGRSRKNPQTGQWENDPNPLYIDCEVFSRPDSKRNLADLIAQYAKKGDPLYIEGRLQLDQWEDKNGGGKRSKHKIVVENIEFLGGRERSDGGGGTERRVRAAGAVRQPRPAPPRTTAEATSTAGGGGSGSGGGGDDPIPF